MGVAVEGLLSRRERDDARAIGEELGYLVMSVGSILSF